MFRIILLFTLLSPFLGIILMEMGAFGIDVLMYGYPNGASFAYFVYLIAFLLTYKFGKRNKLSWAASSALFKDETNDNINFQPKKIRKKFKLAIFVLLFFLFLMLFVFGGINVVMGNMGKGEFRVSFGFFGAVPFYITKLFAPAIIAYLTSYYVVFKSRVSGLGKLYTISIIIGFLIGASWGFKSTAIMILLPATIILWQKISLRKIILIGALGLVIFTSFAVFYDSRDFAISDINTTLTNFSIEETFDVKNLNAFSAVLYRLTVVQGNSAWRIWDLYESGMQMPNYWKTFLSIFGDKFLSWSGVTRSNTDAFIQYHYSATTTDLIRKATTNESFEYNVTATAFSDGVIMGGLFGIFCIGLLAGYLSRLIKIKMILFFNTGNFIGLSIIVVFFTSYFRAWLNSGGFSSLLNVSLFVGLGLTFLFLKYFEYFSKAKI